MQLNSYTDSCLEIFICDNYLYLLSTYNTLDSALTALGVFSLTFIGSLYGKHQYSHFTDERIETLAQCEWQN